MVWVIFGKDFYVDNRVMIVIILCTFEKEENSKVIFNFVYFGIIISLLRIILLDVYQSFKTKDNKKELTTDFLSESTVIIKDVLV